MPEQFETVTDAMIGRAEAINVMSEDGLRDAVVSPARWFSTVQHDSPSRLVTGPLEITVRTSQELADVIDRIAAVKGPVLDSVSSECERELFPEK